MKQMDLPDLPTPEAGAAHWDARLRSPESSDVERAAFTAWRDASPANRAAFETLQDTLHCLREARHRPELRAIRDAALGQAHLHRRQAWLWPAALAASLVVVTAAGLWFGRELFNPDVSAWRVSVQTDVGDHREVMLPDGSTVSVGARSKLSVEFTNRMRRVQMEEGAAYFTVAHEATRPFVVSAGTGTITAMGTAFNVHHLARRVVVTVVEGGVEVASLATIRAIGESPATRAPTRVQAGEQLEYGETLMPARHVDPGMAVTWREGYLQYRNEPLEFVIPDVQRYTLKRLVIADESVGQLRFTGAVIQDQVDDWLKGLETSMPQIDVIAINDHTVLLKSRVPAR